MVSLELPCEQDRRRIINAVPCGTQTASASPEEMRRRCQRYHLTRIKILRIRDVAERVYWVHEQRTLQQERRPDVLELVVVGPDHAELVEAREREQRP